MEQRPLGSTGLTVSALGFGCGAVGGLMVRGEFTDQVAAVERAIAAGITYFDTAALYGNGRSEENLGRVLGELEAWDQVVVGTKVRLDASGLADPVAGVRSSLLESLRRIGRERIDLLQLHNQLSITTNAERGSAGIDRLEDIAEGMRRVIDEGLVDHAGFTGLGDAGALHRALDAGHFETVQAYFNAINPSSGFKGVSGGGQDLEGLIDHAAERGLGVIAIRVMAAGAMVGTSQRAPLAGGTGGALASGNEYERDSERARRLEPLVAELGVESALELSLRFVLNKPGISTALVGYSDQDQLEAAIRWAERGPLDEKAVERVVERAGS
jgi:aryl-alcohol dehydrogenase-like predicted oxidoreductase